MIPNTAADKELNAAVNKAIDADKRQVTIADKELNVAADKAVDSDKRWNAVAGKYPNAVVEPSILIKDQIIRWTKLKDWIRVKWIAGQILYRFVSN